jgi:hypothetical protein
LGGGDDVAYVVVGGSASAEAWVGTVAEVGPAVRGRLSA